jgi:hypothetical protein
MLKQRFYIDGVEVNEPNNYALNEIELNFDKGSDRAQLSIDGWELGVSDARNVNDAEIIARKHLADGLTGGVGVTEGKPLRIELDNGGVPKVLFDGYLDLWTAKYECGKITAKAIEQGKVDWLQSGVAEFSFEFLASINLITEANYVMVPYIISTVPNYREAFMATITIFIVTGELFAQIEDITEKTPEAFNPFEASVIVRLVLRIVYIATLLIALIKLIIDVYNLVIQPIKYHACMYVNDLLSIGASFLGLTYSSSFLQASPLNKLVILPEKFNTKTNTDGIFQAVKGLFTPDKTAQKGYPSFGYTFADLLSAIQLQFYAKIIMDGTTLRIEKQNFNLSVPLYQIPAVERTEFTLNESDFFSNFVIKYQTDINDRNTLQEYLGTLYQVQIGQPYSINRKMVMTKRLQTIYINFALGKRKTELTFPEKIFDVFFKVVGEIIDILVTVLNAIIDVINGIIKLLNKIIKILKNLGIDVGFEIPSIPNLDPPTFGNVIEDRIGMLKMETDFVNVPKMLLIGNNSDARNNKLLPENESVLSAKYLWDNFHYLKSFVGQGDNPIGNQYYEYPLPKVPFTYDDYIKVRNDNRVIDTDGLQVGIIKSLKWNIEEQTAEGNFIIQKKYSVNLQEFKTEPNGV